MDNYKKTLSENFGKKILRVRDRYGNSIWHATSHSDDIDVTKFIFSLKGTQLNNQYSFDGLQPFLNLCDFEKDLKKIKFVIRLSSLFILLPMKITN